MWQVSSKWSLLIIAREEFLKRYLILFAFKEIICLHIEILLYKYQKKRDDNDKKAPDS